MSGAPRGAAHAAPQGSVFVEFSDFKSVDAFLNADPKPAWNGEDLLIMTKCVSARPVSLTQPGPGRRTAT